MINITQLEGHRIRTDANLTSVVKERHVKHMLGGTFEIALTEKNMKLYLSGAHDKYGEIYYLNLNNIPLMSKLNRQLTYQGLIQILKNAFKTHKIDTNIDDALLSEFTERPKIQYYGRDDDDEDYNEREEDDAYHEWLVDNIDQLKKDFIKKNKKQYDEWKEKEGEDATDDEFVEENEYEFEIYRDKIWNIEKDD